MNKLFLIFFTILIAINSSASTLKNGAYAHKKRVNAVWGAVRKIKSYPKLLCLAMDCKEGTISNTVSDWKVDTGLINDWAARGIIKNGILDAETQEIIIVTYFGARKPVWGVEASKKIALANPWIYPRNSWLDSIPGYELIQKIKRTKHVLTFTAPIPPFHQSIAEHNRNQ